MGETLKDYREAGLLQELLPILQKHSAGLILGTGDDVAISQSPGNSRLVWTIDSMIEGTHFQFYDDPQATARALGAKLVVSNVSDLASKGARPLWALISFGVPSSARMDRVREFYHGVDERLMRHGARLIGGDTFVAPQWTLTLALVGVLEEGAAIASRDRARPGQGVYITGWPGESGAGYAILSGKRTAEGKTRQRLVMRHVCPMSCLDTGVTLATSFDDLAMIDVSDGVAKDSGEIARASGMAVILEKDQLPVSEALAEFAKANGADPLKYVLYGGEDYELLFTTAASPQHVEAALAEYGHMIPVRRIGRVEPGEGVYLESPDGKREHLEAEGFEHFA